jgi:CBS domain-containing protein
VITGSTEVDARRRHPTASPTPWRTPLVADIMIRTVVTARPETLLPELIDEMVRYGISGVPIVDSDGRLVGIVSEADLMSKPAYGGTHRRPLAAIGDLLRGHDRRWLVKSEALSAGEIMTTKVATTRSTETVRGAARRMVERGVKRLPVVDGGRLVGIISRADVLTSMHHSDEELRREIGAAFRDPARVPEAAVIDVSVNDGIVTLRGSVQFPIDVPVLSAIAWRFPGVVDVRNEAISREPNPQPPSAQRDYYDYMRFMR